MKSLTVAIAALCLFIWSVSPAQAQYGNSQGRNNNQQQSDSGSDDQNADPNADSNQGIASGRYATQCGCWGPAMPGQTVTAAACSSGMATAEMCRSYCPMGGSQWHGKCQ
jgi:hypothetical protein